VKEFSKDVLAINAYEETERISGFIKETILKNMRKRGAVIGLSGGIDSALSAALCVKALGSEKVLGIILPEKDSSSVSEEYAFLLAERLGVKTKKIDITPLLEMFGAYEKRDQVVSKIFPDFDPSTWLYKIVLPKNLLEKDQLNFFSLVVQLPDGSEKKKRLSAQDYLQIVASTNIKQRTRMVLLYYFAEKHNYAVAGTTNRTEVRQGFFVKYGDGGVDIEPLAHLYKTQVDMIAKHLDIPEEIIKRTPTPDTYTAEVSDTEFYFSVPFDILDPFLWADENNIPEARICEALSLTDKQYKRLKRNIDSKAAATWHYLQTPPTLT
jgi:NAD+ synthase